MTEEILELVDGQLFGVWFLIGAALVFWMHAGFAMVEAGFLCLIELEGLKGRSKLEGYPVESVIQYPGN